MRFVPRNPGYTPDPKAREELSAQLGIPRAMAECLIARGVTDPEEARLFFEGGLDLLNDPFLLDGMREAVECIEEAVEEDVPIMVYGDYDVDGTCATSILVDYFTMMGASSVESMIPSRHLEGYGLHPQSIQTMIEKGIGLLVTVDCGISNAAEVAEAKAHGIRVVVTDHHECPEVLPEADAVIDPKKPGQDYPFSGLCGTGVAGKLVEALSDTETMLEYADLIALATVADLVPLTDENRPLVKIGLDAINEGPRPGIAALLKVAGLEPGNISAGQLGFQLGPRINAGGRIDLAGKAVELLTTDDPDRAREIAEDLEQNNRARQAIEKAMLYEAELKLEREVDFSRDRGIVLWNKNWNSGVLGIVASRLAETRNRPTVLLGGDGEAYYGSARSVTGVNLYRVLCECGDVFERFGGHEQAAGMAVKEENLERFRVRFNEVLAREDELLFVPTRQYDVKLPLSEITRELAESLRLLEPMGMGNPNPVFLTEGVRITDIRRMGKENNHYRATLTSGAAAVSAVAWRQDPPEFDGDFSVLLEPGLNEYRGQSSLQATVKYACPENKAADLAARLSSETDRMERSYLEEVLVREEEVPRQEHTLTERQFWTMLSRRAIGTLIICANVSAAKAFFTSPRYDSVRNSFTVAWGTAAGALPGQNLLLLAPHWEALNVSGFSRVLFLDAHTAVGVRNSLAKQLRGAHFGFIMEGSRSGLAEVSEPPVWTTQSMRGAYAALRRLLRQGKSWGSSEMLMTTAAGLLEVSAWKLEAAVRVFEELGFLIRTEGEPYLTINENAPKTELEKSGTWRAMGEMRIR